MELKLRARAKINLSIEIIKKREDGYHDLSMIMQSIDLYDTIKVVLNDKKTIDFNTNQPFGKAHENIAYKAAELFFKRMNLDQGCEIYLEKKIPAEAGLAGGSTDAAAVLLALDKLTDTRLSKETLIQMANELGADVPFCLFGGTMLAQGTGNILEELPFVEKDLLIIKPDQSVSTRDLFKSLDQDDFSSGDQTLALAQAIREGETEGLGNLMVNRMYKKSLMLAPEMGKIIDQLENQLNCERALMSGAGSTIFSFFKSEEDLDQAYQFFENKYKHVYKTKTCRESIRFE